MILDYIDHRMFFSIHSIQFHCHHVVYFQMFSINYLLLFGARLTLVSSGNLITLKHISNMFFHPLASARSIFPVNIVAPKAFSRYVPKFFLKHHLTFSYLLLIHVLFQSLGVHQHSHCAAGDWIHLLVPHFSYFAH